MGLEHRGKAEVTELNIELIYFVTDYLRQRCSYLFMIPVLSR